jgi:hypothetical protein
VVRPPDQPLVSISMASAVAGTCRQSRGMKGWWNEGMREGSTGPLSSRVANHIAARGINTARSSSPVDTRQTTYEKPLARVVPDLEHPRSTVSVRNLQSNSTPYPAVDVYPPALAILTPPQKITTKHRNAGSFADPSQPQRSQLPEQSWLQLQRPREQHAFAASVRFYDSRPPRPTAKSASSSHSDSRREVRARAQS